MLKIVGKNSVVVAKSPAALGWSTLPKIPARGEKARGRATESRRGFSASISILTQPFGPGTILVLNPSGRVQLLFAIYKL
jgi:hypothetical protein